MSPSSENEPDFSGFIAECLGDESMTDKFGRGHFTVHETSSPSNGDARVFELLVTPEYGESAQAQRYRVTVELIKE